MSREQSVPPRKVYLGDSIYAQINEYGSLVLTTENGLPSDPSNKIFLEPEVYEALKIFIRAEEWMK